MASLFWDNSNIWLVGRNAVCKNLEQGDMDDFRIHIANLFNYVAQGRKIDYAFMAGSVPPRTDDLWKRFAALNIKYDTQERGVSGGEIAVDEAIQFAMGNRIMDIHPNTEPIILLTGDGAGYSEGKGFIKSLERAIKFKCPIEVVSWDAGVNKYLKKFAEANGKYVPLEPGYQKITFINNKRWALPV